MNATHPVHTGTARTAMRIEDDPDEWEIVDQDGERVGIIWRCAGGWRSAATEAPAHRGISGDTFDEVLEHAIANF